MASTYSSLKFELIGTGDQAGTWGASTNTNLGTAIEQAITGTVNVAFSSADVTLTLTDTNEAQNARALRLNLTGTSGGARNLIVPGISKQYIVNNGLADAVTVKNATGSGIAIPAGKTMVVFNNATNVLDVTNYAPSMTLGTPLPAGSGGTGVNALGTGVAVAFGQNVTGTGGIVLATSPTLVTPVLGVAAATTVNKTAITAPATGSTLAIADGKTFTASNTVTLAGTDGTVITLPPETSAVGFMNLPVNSQSAAYTTVLTDAGKFIFHPAADAVARTFTIADNATVAYPIGTAISFVNLSSAAVTIAIGGSDVLYLAGTGSTGSRTLAAFGVCTALKLNTISWLITGNGIT